MKENLVHIHPRGIVENCLEFVNWDIWWELKQIFRGYQRKMNLKYRTSCCEDIQVRSKQYMMIVRNETDSTQIMVDLPLACIENNFRIYLFHSLFEITWKRTHITSFDARIIFLCQTCVLQWRLSTWDREINVRQVTIEVHWRDCFQMYSNNRWEKDFFIGICMQISSVIIYEYWNWVKEREKMNNDERIRCIRQLHSIE